MKKNILFFLSILALIFSCKGAEKTSSTSSQDAKLTILSTTDLHMSILNYDYFQDKVVKGKGLPYVYSMVKKIRSENDNVMLFDDGDIIEGNPFGDFFARVEPLKKGQEHPMIKAMELLKYDVIGLGNHEFNFGYDYIKNVVNSAKTPMINANIIDTKTQTNAFKPYIILDKKIKLSNGEEQNIKVGVISVVPIKVPLWDKISLKGQIDALPPVKQIQKFVPQMKQEGADIVVVLSHMGINTKEYSDKMENASYYVSKIKDVDALITGHSHRKFPALKDAKYQDYPDSEEFAIDNKNGTINGMPTVMASTQGDVLGQIDLLLSFDNGKWVVKSGSSHLEPMLDSDGNEIVKPSDVIINSISEENEKVLKYIRQPIGKTKSDINSYFSLVKDNPSIQIVAKAQKLYAQNQLKGTEDENLPILSSAAPFKAGYRGGYTNFKKGTLTIKNLTELYLYPNTIVLLKLKASQIREWLEWSSNMFNTIKPNSQDQELLNNRFPTYNFDVIYGIQYQIDVSKEPRYSKDFELINPNSHRIVNITYNGESIDENQDFIVVTNNYRASTNPIINPDDKNIYLVTAEENRKAVMEYIQQKGEITGDTEPNWSFLPINSTATFKTSLDAKKYLDKFSDIKFVKDTKEKENVGIFEINL